MVIINILETEIAWHLTVWFQKCYLLISLQHAVRYESILSIWDMISILTSTINAPCFYHLYLQSKCICTNVCLHMPFFFFFKLRSQPNRLKFSLNTLSKATKAIRNQESLHYKNKSYHFVIASWISKHFLEEVDRYSSLRSFLYQPSSLNYLNKYFMKRSHHRVTSLLFKFPILFTSKIVVDGK